MAPTSPSAGQAAWSVRTLLAWAAGAGALAAAVSLATENARLAAQSRARLAELRAVRARLVESADAARRRLERDLHDGAQQRLVSLALTLRLASARLADQPDRARGLLESAHKELDAALTELRDLAHGLHPALLTERGLTAALNGLTHRAPLPVQLTGHPGGRLPAEIETTAYYVAAEAITNTAKHARASHATITIRRATGALTVEITDDGIGGASPPNGAGLRGLADRLAALDGRLHLHSPLGQGTTVRATIPCPPPATHLPNR